uniref:Uncharacterized protein n=1 Tax=Arundo donax TaxID=35708 RepID=A0A0A9FGK4_ARUDO
MEHWQRNAMRMVSLFFFVPFILKAYVSDGMDPKFIDLVCIAEYLTKLCL